MRFFRASKKGEQSCRDLNGLPQIGASAPLTADGAEIDLSRFRTFSNTDEAAVTTCPGLRATGAPILTVRSSSSSDWNTTGTCLLSLLFADGSAAWHRLSRAALFLTRRHLQFRCLL